MENNKILNNNIKNNLQSSKGGMLKISDKIEIIPKSTFNYLSAEGKFDDSFIIKKEYSKNIDIGGFISKSNKENPFSNPINKLTGLDESFLKGEIYLFKLNESSQPSEFSDREIDNIVTLLNPENYLPDSGYILMKGGILDYSVFGSDLDRQTILRQYLGHHSGVTCSISLPNESINVALYLEKEPEFEEYNLNYLGKKLFNETVYGNIILGSIAVNGEETPLNKEGLILITEYLDFLKKVE